MKLTLLMAMCMLVSCISPGARYMGMHGENHVYEVYCPNDVRACEQVARQACRNADWTVVLEGDPSATTRHFWLECQY